MSRSALCLLLLAALVASSAAQPANGDLILSFYQLSTLGTITGGFTAAFPQSNPENWTTIARAPANHSHNWVRMAPNNTDLVIAQCNGQVWQSNLVNSDPAGRQYTVSPSLPVRMDGFELDHDDCWIVSGQNRTFHHLFGIQHTGGTGRTFLTVTGITPAFFNEVAIDRDPGGPMYAIGVWNPPSLTASSPRILHASRGGIVHSLSWDGNPLLDLLSIELHPRTGHYLTTDGAAVCLAPKMATKSSVRTLTAFSRPNAARIDQDDTAWIVGWLGSTQTIMRYCLTKNTVVSLIQLRGMPVRSFATGIEIYGSRTLVCNQSASNVTINVQSRLPGARGKGYALAASFARRQGIPFVRPGEWLHLDTTGPLFLLSALNLLPPSIFQNFRGNLNAFGNATATVNISAPLRGLGIPIFVAGIIYDQNGVIQVTNTHWFVL